MKNLKKFRVVALTLAIVLLFGTVSSFAYAWQKAPLDDSDPIITVLYERADTRDTSLPFDQMTVVVSHGDISGVVELNGILYELNKTYTVTKQVKSGHFVSENKAYDFYQVGEMGPSPMSFYDFEKGENVTVYGGHYAYAFELIKSDESPKSILQAPSAEEPTVEAPVAEEPAVEETAVEETAAATSIKEEPAAKTPAVEAPASEEPVTAEAPVAESPVVPVAEAPAAQEVNEDVAVTSPSSDESDAEEAAEVKPTRAKIVSLLSKKASAKIRWNPIKNASAFQIQYSTSKHFKHAKSVTVKNTTKSKTIKKLKRHRKYYVRVRALNGNKSGHWSKVRVIRTK